MLGKLPKAKPTEYRLSPAMERLYDAWPAPDDRRRSIVALTERGRSHFQELAAAHHGWIATMFAAMPDDKLAALYDLLAALKTSLGAEQQETA